MRKPTGNSGLPRGPRGSGVAGLFASRGWRSVKYHLKFPPPYHLKLPPPVIPVLGVREGAAPPRHSAQKATTIMRAPALRTWA